MMRVDREKISGRVPFCNWRGLSKYSLCLVSTANSKLGSKASKVQFILRVFASPDHTLCNRSKYKLLKTTKSQMWSRGTRISVPSSSGKNVNPVEIWLSIRVVTHMAVDHDSSNTAVWWRSSPDVYPASTNQNTNTGKNTNTNTVYPDSRCNCTAVCWRSWPYVLVSSASTPLILPWQ